jgi:hypothetical protein
MDLPAWFHGCFGETDEGGKAYLPFFDEKDRPSYLERENSSMERYPLATLVADGIPAPIPTFPDGDNPLLIEVDITRYGCVCNMERTKAYSISYASKTWLSS